MIASRIKENTIEIQVTVKGDYEERTSWAMLDSGFSLGIALPLNAALRLGLSHIGVGKVVTADGQVHTVGIFIGKVRVGNADFEETTFIVMGDMFLVGMHTLGSYLVCFHVDKNKVTIEEKQSFNKDKHISRLSDTLHNIIPR